MKMLPRFALGLGFATSLLGCLSDVPEAGDPDDLIDPEAADQDADAALRGNGEVCVASPYNCRFHAASGQRVMNGTSESWSVTQGVTLRAGDGQPLGTEDGGIPRTFNYGQVKTIAGEPHALMLASANRSAAWYPIAQIKKAAEFRAADREVIEAKDPNAAGRLGCYDIRETVDYSRSPKKVVKGTTSAEHDDLGDYLPLQRANGQRSVNIVFSVPGFALGGATTDHVLTRNADGSRTQFQRMDVPTDSGKPSISIPLWVKDGNGKNLQQSGTARFLYGFITLNGHHRWGWMAEDALTASTRACPQ